MNNKVIDTRNIKVDYDIAEQKQGYKVNTDDDSNKLYNKVTVKNERSKRIRKDRNEKKE